MVAVHAYVTRETGERPLVSRADPRCPPLGSRARLRISLCRRPPHYRFLRIRISQPNPICRCRRTTVDRWSHLEILARRRGTRLARNTDQRQATSQSRSPPAPACGSSTPKISAALVPSRHSPTAACRPTLRFFTALSGSRSSSPSHSFSHSSISSWSASSDAPTRPRLLCCDRALAGPHRHVQNHQSRRPPLDLVPQALLAYLVFLKHRHYRYLILSGILVGLALLTKYVANFIICC